MPNVLYQLITIYLFLDRKRDFPSTIVLLNNYNLIITIIVIIKLLSLTDVTSIVI